ncbi:N-acetylglucosamine-6-phosphate deacetylase [Acidiphilium acidophilum]|uniref:N-acetylglucosamine-6-phosphate deacetylase n=1 Tax=Acidiphilium acidophilum TaxID=76588 RepID=A0AAW9DN51_ACIAO|nr:N-acetylglucosamine-6-phosphate deacetylase [Acidiphilium acidophilum]MDX5930599.1 N-acetylglucosamine-6-phosphate deacetylase [Acidiphilium acidophilum]
MILAAPRLFRDGRFEAEGALVIEAGRIVAVLGHIPADADLILPHGILAPGLIDLHNNGAFGIDCATADTDGFEHLCRSLAQSGVTSFLPTIITAPIPDLHDAAARIRTAIGALTAAPLAQMPGLHLEGPFLARARRGAHRADWLLTPDAPTLETLLAPDALRATLRLITLAPELPHAIAAIERLTRSAIAIALGHTDADAATATRAIEAGARLATHVFTAMRPFHHRDPGMIGVALTDPRLAACFIADGVHSDPIALRLGFAATGMRAVAVTDSISLAGLPRGSTTAFGGAGAIAEGGAARRPDGTLTGATITLDEGIRRLIAAGIPPEAALHAATQAPAHAIGLTDRGRLAAGCRADLIWLDDDFNVQNTWIAGVPIRPVASAPPRKPRLPATETLNPSATDLDEQPSEAIIALLFAQEAHAQHALRRIAPALATLADAVALKLREGGRLFYAGAGTSGRLAVLDAVECGPTFSLPPGIIIPLIAGGDAAIAGAVEGAEDDTEAASRLLAHHGIGPGDALIGIAASGSTPFTRAALSHAKAAGALTGCIVNSAGIMTDEVDHSIVIASGAEVLAGSTRLSAGTTQKIALNALSTTIMIRLGKSFGPYMVDLRATNLKLRDRATRIVAAIAGCDAATARALLERCDFEVKTALVMHRHDLDPTAARAHLAGHRSHLRHALSSRPTA